MKLAVLFALCLPCLGTTYYVAANGSAASNGAIGSPWTLAHAIGGTSPAQPGDTIYLRAGTYGDNTTVFMTAITGTIQSPIIIRNYPGERATIDGSIQFWSPHIWVWGLEFLSSKPGPRTDGRSALDGVNFYAGSLGCKVINSIFHDLGQGIGFWRYSETSELYGNIISQNGYESDRGHGHGIYVQNETGTKTIEDNILFDGYGIGVHSFGSTNGVGIVLRGNTIINSGSNALNHESADNILINHGYQANYVVDENYTYHNPALSKGYHRFNWQLDPGTAVDLTLTDNVFMGGQYNDVSRWESVAASGNRIYVTSAGFFQFRALGHGTTGFTGWSWDNNEWWGVNRWRVDASGNVSYDNWKTLTGFDVNSTYTSAAPAGTWIYIRPNKYESGRANITIYNWDLDASVAVDLSSVVANGAAYEIRDAQNWYGDPVVSGTYSGGTVSVPMSNLTKTQGISLHNETPHTGPQFAAFVVLASEGAPPAGVSRSLKGAGTARGRTLR